jgi:hypothetical protein
VKVKVPASGSQVASMPEDARFDHVRRHLYNEPERWGDIVEGLPTPPSKRARAAGCSGRAMGRGRLHIERVSQTCIQQVSLDHDEFLEPAYRSALDTACATGRVGRAHEDEHRKLRAVGDNGVFLFLRGKAATVWVSSAIRVRPGGCRNPSREDFFNSAVRKLRDTTSWK